MLADRACRLWCKIRALFHPMGRYRIIALHAAHSNPPSNGQSSRALQLPETEPTPLNSQLEQTLDPNSDSRQIGDGADR